MTELEMLKLAREGHVRMIADLAAERDKLKRERDAYKRAKEENDERFLLRAIDAERERDELRAERDELLWKIPNH
jgi:hypothetical protein